ncbi:MAG: hypothetical protein Q9188_005667, partial [Gyalolechia gomerana]
HLAIVALTAMVLAHAAVTVLASLAPTAVASTAVHAPAVPDAAEQAARLKGPIAVAMATSAKRAISVAETAAARPKAVSVAPTQRDPCSEEIASRTGGTTSRNESGGGNVPAPAPSSSYSIPDDVSVSTFDPSDDAPLPTPTIPSLPTIPAAAASITSFTLPTVTAASSPGAVMRTFSSTLTIYYYTVYVLTTTFVRTETAFVTSSYTYTTAKVTALATDDLDADLVFGTLALGIYDMPTPTLTASNARDFSRTYGDAVAEATSRTRSQITGVGGVGAVSAAAGGKKAMRWEWGSVLLWGVVGLWAGLGMVSL